MGTIYSIKNSSPFDFDESDFDSENSSKMYRSLSRSSYPKGKKLGDKKVIVHQVDEGVNERISRSDAGLQSSSSNYASNYLSRSKRTDLFTFLTGETSKASSSLKAANDKKNSNCTQGRHLENVELVSIISDDDTENISTTNDPADSEGSSEEQILEHEITSPEREPSVVIYPECVRNGKSCYQKAQMSFSRNFIRLGVTEDGATGSLTFEWKTVDLISIESQWSDPFITAEVGLRIKVEKSTTGVQKSGILELSLTVSDPHWANTQERIKVLDEQYKEKWNVDLESYELFENETCLEAVCGSISISKNDFQLLQPERFINDTIVDFYIEYLKKIKPADARVHFFNSFFFRKLADLDENQSKSFDAKAAFQQVRKWTKKVNLFQKDYIFIPINFRLHWSLIVICHPGEIVNFTDDEIASSPKVPCILHMDSIKGSHRGLESRFIRCYLLEEWKERYSDIAEDISRKFMDLRFLRLEVPQQQNSYDCGLFMLHNMELFLKQAADNFNPLASFISKNWFHPIEASLKRARIKRLIFELAKSKTQSSDCNDKSSYDLKDEDGEETEVEILHETCNRKEPCCESISNPDAPLTVKPLRSKPYLCSESSDMNIDPSDGDIDGATSSLEDIQSHCEEFPEGGGDEGSSVAVNEYNHRQLVLYDPSKLLSPIKLEENSLPTASGGDVHESLVVEDSDGYASDKVFETCVVEDSDPEDSAELGSVCKNTYPPFHLEASTLSLRKDVEALKRRQQPMFLEARKRPRRSPRLKIM
uniref:probable ubiquitin-like-specific protease 2B isoform X2 n=1 Tax=Erigeron canadensis TaxID=72917 RepID=UPI001CB9A2A5|nr:probable ubiquitin-like-specific protease 2B isoform X2 [Erigeron canadensis]